MGDAIADTQAVVWYFFRTSSLSRAAFSTLDRSYRANRLFISAMTLVEAHYLSGKPNSPFPTAYQRLTQIVSGPRPWLRVRSITPAVVRAFDFLPRAEIPEMGDRLIAATAVTYGLPLVTSDADLRGSAALAARVPVLW